jgi:hypothetical protein
MGGGLIWALTEAAARKVVYTTLAVLVEIANSRGVAGSGDIPANHACLSQF